jgi:putative membrane protein
MRKVETGDRDDCEMTLQQDLAVQRTWLANERTLLAYVRTFMGFVGLGVALIALFATQAGVILGAVSIATGSVVMIIGLTSYTRTRSALVKEHRELRERVGGS